MFERVGLGIAGKSAAMGIAKVSKPATKPSGDEEIVFDGGRAEDNYEGTDPLDGGNANG